MAGGPLAHEVTCFECLEQGAITKAIRSHEGTESDQYRCERGHQFGIDYRRGPATEAAWPPDPAVVEAFKRT